VFLDDLPQSRSERAVAIEELRPFGIQANLVVGGAEYRDGLLAARIV
jgi:hypothetical protein